MEQPISFRLHSQKQTTIACEAEPVFSCRNLSSFDYTIARIFQTGNEEENHGLDRMNG